jgi:hypothetical protein
MKRLSFRRLAVSSIAWLGLWPWRNAFIKSIKIAVNRLMWRSSTRKRMRNASRREIKIVFLLLAIVLPYCAQAIELTPFNEWPAEMNRGSQLWPAAIENGRALIRRNFQFGAYLRSNSQKSISSFLASLPPKPDHTAANTHSCTGEEAKEIAHKLFAIALGVALALLIAGRGGDRGLRLFNRAIDVMDSVRHWRKRPNENKMSHHWRGRAWQRDVKFESWKTWAYAGQWLAPSPG